MTNPNASQSLPSTWKRMIAAVSGLDVRRLPALIAALLIAEMFFKFGSFTLECVAFLVLWRGLDLAMERLILNQS